MATDLPKHDQLADEFDELDWDRDVVGPMVNFATRPEHEPVTVPLDPEVHPCPE